MYSGDEIYGDDVTSGPAEGEPFPRQQWPAVEEGAEVTVVCPYCENGEIAYDELVPRSLGMNVVRTSDGRLVAEPDGSKFDECAWEESRTVGLVCRSCGSLWNPREGESIEELLARIGIVKTPAPMVEPGEAD